MTFKQYRNSNDELILAIKFNGSLEMSTDLITRLGSQMELYEVGDDNKYFLEIKNNFGEKDLLKDGDYLVLNIDGPKVILEEEFNNKFK